MTGKHLRLRLRPFFFLGVFLISLIACGRAVRACSECPCCLPGGSGAESHGAESHSHGHGHSHGGTDSYASTLLNAFSTSSGSASASSGPVKFAVIGDTQNGEFGGHSNLVTRLMESINTHSDIEYVLFPGDLIGDTGSSGWAAWESRTSILGTNSLGRDKRLMNPGNHDRGSGGTFANWQSTFNWLPNSQSLNGQQGVDQVDYYVDHGNVRFLSISTDAPGSIYNGRHVNSAPPALDWMREVMKDVDARNADANMTNDIDHVFTFSHRPVTTQFESPTGGTNGDWWRSMTGQDAQSGNHASTAFIPGHWHMYQPSRPDPNVDTMEIISGTGGGGLEGQPHRNRHGYSIIEVNGGTVTSEFYGDFNQGSDNWNFQLLDSYTVAQTGGLPTGELAFYEFENGATDEDSSVSALSKGHTLNFNSGAGTTNDPQQGRVLDLSSGGYVDAKDIGDNNLAVLRDLTVSLYAKADNLAVGQNVLVSFGGADGSFNGSLNSQESANHAYRLSINSSGILAMEWRHDDGTWETISSTAAVSDPENWHLYEFKRDADTKGVGFFVDGQPLGVVPGFDFLPTGAGSGSLYIGADAGGALRFDGWIDDVNISSAPVSLLPVTILVADLDGDQDVDGADWLLFIAGSGTANPGNTDLNLDGFNNFDDFVIFKDAYNAFNPGSSFDEMLASVPEPSSLALLLLGILWPVCGVRRSRRV